MWGYEFIPNTIVRHCSTLCLDMNLLSTQLFDIVQRYVRYEFIVNTIVRHCSTICEDMNLLSTQLFGIVQRYVWIWIYWTQLIWIYCQHNCSALFNAMWGYEFIVNTIVRHCSTICEDMNLFNTIVRHCSTLCLDMNLLSTQLFDIVQRYVRIWIYCQHNCSALFNDMWGYEFIPNTIVRHCSTLCEDMNLLSTQLFDIVQRYVRIWIYCQHNCSALFNAMWGYEFIVNTIVRHCSTLCEDMNLLSTQLFDIVQRYVRIWIYCQHNCSTLFNAMWGYEFIVNTIVRHCSTICEDMNLLSTQLFGIVQRYVRIWIYCSQLFGIFNAMWWIWIYCQHNCSTLFNAMWGYEFIVNTIVRHCSTLCQDMNLLSTQLFGIVQRYCVRGYEFIVNTIVRHCSTLCEDMNLLSTQLFDIVQRYVRIWFIVNTIVRHCSTICEDMNLFNTIVRHCSTLCLDMNLLSTQLFDIVQRYVRIWIYCQHNCSTLFNAMSGYVFIVNTIVRHCSTLCEDMTLLSTQLFGIVQRYVRIWIYSQHNCSALFNAMSGYEFIVNTIVRHCSTLCEDMNLLSTQLFGIVQRYVRIWIYCQHNCSALFNAMWGYEFIVNTIVRHCSTLCEDMNLLSTQLFGIVQRYVRIWIYCQHNCSTLFNDMWGYEFIPNTIVRHCSTMSGYEFIVNTIVRHCSTICEDMNLLSTQLFGIVQRYVRIWIYCQHNTIVRHCSTLCEDMNLFPTQLFGIVQRYVWIWIYCQHNCSTLFNAMWGYEFIVNTIVRHCSTLCEDMNLLSTQLFGIVQRYVRIWIYSQHNCSALFNAMSGYEFIVNTIVRHCSTLCEDMNMWGYEFIVNTIVRHCSTLCEDMNLLSTQLFDIVQRLRIWIYCQHNCSTLFNAMWGYEFIVNTIVRHCSTLCEDMNLLSTQLFGIVQR